LPVVKRNVMPDLGSSGAAVAFFSIDRQITRRSSGADELEPGWNVVLVLGFRFCLGCKFGIGLAFAAMVGIARAGEGPDGAGFPKAPVKFDIPAQPLSNAL
jgi:hypothetical protein